jgi:hypothetical protein
MLPDKLLINLRILSKIQKNGRITKSVEGIINLEQDTVYKNIKRFIYSDSRRQSVFEINSIIDECSFQLNNLINSKYIHPNHKNTSEYIRNMEIITLLMEELTKAKSGIENLKFTYKNDPNIISQIDIIILKINSIVKDVNVRLEINGNNELLMNDVEDN